MELPPLVQSLYGHPLYGWVLGTVVAALVIVVGFGLRRFARARLQRAADAWVVSPWRFFAQFRWYVLAIAAVYLGIAASPVDEEIVTMARRAFTVAFLLQAGFWGVELIQMGIARQERIRGGDPAFHTVVGVIRVVLRIFVWAMALLLILDNLGVNVTALVAGLGLAGLAIGMALQNILGDLIASFSIVLDKPVEVGDFIMVGDLMGTVQHIGIRSTRLESLSGEQLVFSNTDLISSRIRNYQRMKERRIVFSFGVVYQTPAAQLEAIPGIVEEIVGPVEGARFDRAHFKAYGDYSLDFEVVYYVTTADYRQYMDIQHAINMALYRSFEERGIEFAYPTRTLYVRGEGGEGATPGS